MIKNPFAKIFIDDFNGRFIKDENLKATANKSTHPVIMKTIHRINANLAKCFDDKEPQLIDASNHYIEPKEFANFCLSLRATMISESKKIPNISSEMSLDTNILNIFDVTTQYFVTNSKKIDDIYDLITHKLEYTDNLKSSKMVLSKLAPQSKDNNVFIFGVNRDNEDNQDLAIKNFRHSMQDIIDEPFFRDTNIFSVSFPTSYPEEIAAPSILNTIKYPKDYGEAELLFVQEKWKNYIGKNIKFDEDGDITSGTKYSPEELSENLKNLTILSYCAGAASAHRCINAFKEVASQLYTQEELKPALKNISVVSYAFLPPEQELDYSNTAIICNDKKASNPEAVVRCNFPELYKQISLKDTDTSQSKITDFGDSKIIALEMPKDVKIKDEKGNLVSREINNRNGHRWQNVTSETMHSTASNVYSYIVKQTLNRKPLEARTINALSDNNTTFYASQNIRN